MTSTRRCLIPVVLAALALAACGSSSSSSSNPLQTELSYIPSSSPLVLTIETDPNGAAIKGVNQFIGRFPFASLGIAALKSRLQQSGVNYDSDIRPLLGNPVAFGATSSTLSSSSAQSNFVFVWTAKNGDQLKSLIQKIPGIHSSGSHDGAALYTTGGQTTVALDGATAVLGPSTAEVQAALDRHANGGGITESDYSKAFTSLPSDGFLKVFGNLTTVLSQPSASQAKQIPWVAALRGYATTVGANSSGLTFSYRLDTTGGTLSASQLPFAPGTTAPSFAANAPITFAMHDPAQVGQFIQSSLQATNPSFLLPGAKTSKVNTAALSQIVKLFTGDLIVASDTKTTAGRVQVNDPAAANAAIPTVLSSPGFLGKHSKVVKAGDLYAVKSAKSRSITLLGVIGNQFVVGRNATPAELRAFAAAPATQAQGAQGTVAFRIALVDLIRAAGSQAVPQSVAPLLNSLGDITGWAASSTSGVTGSATLAVK